MWLAIAMGLALAIGVAIGACQPSTTTPAPPSPSTAAVSLRPMSSPAPRASHESADAIADFDVDSGVWFVGLLSYGHNGRNVLNAAYLDAYSGEVFAIRESVIND
jgi:hypothetical protein